MGVDAFNAAVDTNPSGIPKEKIKELIAALPERLDDFSSALLIAGAALCRKKNWTGGSYALHYLHVADTSSEYVSLEEKIVGLLHDVVEDSDWTREDLVEMGFSNPVVYAVEALTKNDKEKYLDAVQRCSINPIARKVKRRDNKHNMDLTRAAVVAGEKQKYHYPVSWHYLGAVEDRIIAPNTSIWEFLQMAPYKNLLTPKNYHYIAQQTSQPIPPAIVAVYGQPRPEVIHHRPVL